jgi:hypothetical protein
VPARIGAKAGECVPASFRGGCETLRCGRAPAVATPSTATSLARLSTWSA